MIHLIKILLFSFALCFTSCSSDDNAMSDLVITDNNDDNTDDQNDDSSNDDDTTDREGLHKAFSDFASDIDIVLLNNQTISIETDGLPNHTSPYWTPSHDLYINPVVANTNRMSPGYIDDFQDTFELQVSANPQKAAQSTATTLGAIGIAVSGAVIYNQNEAGNVQITENIASGLDYSGAHTGPSSYHYHFEPTAFSDDDANLVGIMSDGFFLYGRKCSSTDTYPTDLDDSNGHTSTTQHNNNGEYHYHIGNTTIYNKYYVNFTGDYQGTPTRISGGRAGGPGGMRPGLF